jgi:Mrp family chromosome partitioning ATPase
MPSLSSESTPRERLERVLTLMKRTRMFWRSAAAIAIVGLGVSVGVALRSKRAWRSETTVLYRDALPAQAGDAESPAARAARLGPKLKDLLYARPKLEAVISEYDLFPEKTRRSMIEAVEEMQTAVGFHAHAEGSFAISFTYEDPAIARDVTARLADLMIKEYNQQNLDTATLTRDFLRRKLEEATAQVDEASHALALFLAQNPQFQWGVNDSPYAPTPMGAPATPVAPPAARPAAPREPAAPADPAAASIERELARVEAELAGPPRAGVAPAAAPPATVGEAQKQRDVAAAALVTAEAALAEKLTSVTPAHPDAISARAKVDAARRALAAADAALTRARAGAAPVAEPAPDLTPEHRRDLEKRRTALRRQLEGRRGHAAAPPPPSAPALAPAPARPGTKEGDVVELETEWHRLRLALDRARDQLHTIQVTARAADLSADAVAKQGHEEMQILEPAYLPTKPDRGRGRVFFAGAAVTLFLTIGWSALRVLLCDTLFDEGDIGAINGPPVLVAMPRSPDPSPPRAERAIVPAVRPGDDGEDVEGTDCGVMVTPPPASDPQPDVACAEAGDSSPPSSCAPFPLVTTPARTLTILDAVFDDPEVEVVGADVDPAGGPEEWITSASAPHVAALRVLRHRLEQKRGDGSFVVAVMSPGRGEGKTPLALRLALTLSEAERARVILVEGHFASPRLAGALGLRIPPEAGFSTQIHRRMNGRGVPWGVVRIGPSLSLLAEPGGVAAYPAAVHSTHFEAALSALRRSYDYVVIDGPGVAGSGDANVIESASDAVLLLVRAGTTRGRDLTRATQQLGDRRVLGVVLET